MKNKISTKNRIFLRSAILSLLCVVILSVLCACNTQDAEQKSDPVITDSELYTATVNYLEREFDRVFSPYYDIQELIPSNWKEAGDEQSATFFYKMTYLYYNRDPDQVSYIRDYKESNPEIYQKFYDAYLALQETNFIFKVVLNDSGDLELYSDNSVTGDPRWEPVVIDDYIISNN